MTRTWLWDSMVLGGTGQQQQFGRPSQEYHQHNQNVFAHITNTTVTMNESMEVDPKSFADVATAAGLNVNASSELGKSVAGLHNAVRELSMSVASLAGNSETTTQQIAGLTDMMRELTHQTTKTSVSTAGVADALVGSRPASPQPGPPPPAGAQGTSATMEALLARMVAVQEEHVQTRRVVEGEQGASLAWRPVNVDRLMVWLRAAKARYPLTNGPQV